ncbi:hypothetical protein [Heliophilum fasciatum]|uniref:Uncharacterized protein n=1 Tax=Heliophilum fasciatum TaxID=35700 RepID=A0A4R2RKX3_9FIRM|nr:hypothetical protein [Heliophilum fasciatum]MCW2278365.1 hypothetical protein [Heliophilum fasciatum]TCP63763.1 hypothetical protein EDD73_1159 [Heliophilum fasciatum]
MVSLEALASKEKALMRLDEEHRRYRQALEAAFTLAEEMLRQALEPMRTEMQAMREQLMSVHAKMEERATIETITGGEHDGQGLSEATGQEPVTTHSAPARGRGRRKTIDTPDKERNARIRWGTTEEEIRQTVFEQLQLLEKRGKEITITTIKTEVPSMMRYVYGERALFCGIGDLIEEYRMAQAPNDGQDSKEAKEAKEPVTVMSRIAELPQPAPISDSVSASPNPTLPIMPAFDLAARSENVAAMETNERPLLQLETETSIFAGTEFR